MAINGYYELKKSTSSGKYSFNLKAGNHETILTSESYFTKAGAKTGIASVQVNGKLDARFEKKVSVRKEPYFVLKAGNGEPIGTSEMYSAEAARDSGIAAVKENCPSTTIKDLTGEA